MAPDLQDRSLYVCGLGDPVMDVLARVNDEFLRSHVTQEPGGCLPVDKETLQRLQEAAATQSELVSVPGGSSANVIRGISNISRGSHVKCKFAGMVGDDETGRRYREKMAAERVEPLLLVSKSGAPSATCLCLISPDGQRTMRTCLGASLELKQAEQLPDSWHEGIKLLHCEGYSLYRPQLAMQMTKAAREHGAIVSLDLASFELVRNCKAALLEILSLGCVDMLFCNQEEAEALSKELALANAEAALEEKLKAVQDYLLQHIKVSVVSLGSRGCVARSRSGEHSVCPAHKVQVVDTCGAGDIFTAGFLYAYLQGASLERCARAGCAAGAEAVQVPGAEMNATGWERLHSATQQILQS